MNFRYTALRTAMKANRRNFLKTSLALGATLASLLDTNLVNADWNATDFAPGSLDATLKQLLNGKPLVATDKIELNIPEIAENGAVVPITVSTRLPDIQRISIVAEKNPVPLAIQSELLPELEPFMSARLKLASTGFVYALAETDKTIFSIKKLVKVTIGGCGG